jgi:alpha-beta hydrolase superfamily lysophospholipase
LVLFCKKELLAYMTKGRKLQVDIGAGASLGATVYGGGGDTALFCFPGGGMTRRYFDLEGASFADAMVQAGIIVVAFDHFGSGESSAVADPFDLTAGALAQAGATAALAMARSLRRGDIAGMLAVPDLRVIGVGHSMGGMIVTMQQALARPYAALALLGFSTRGLPEVLTDDEKAVAAQESRGDADYRRLAQLRFGAGLADINTRLGGSAALTEAAGPLLTVSAMQSMLPGNVTAEAAAVDVPIFLAVGDRDIAGRPERIPAAFSASPDIRLHVMENAGHHPFVAPSASVLYAALHAWVADILVPA